MASARSALPVWARLSPMQSSTRPVGVSASCQSLVTSCSSVSALALGHSLPFSMAVDWDMPRRLSRSSSRRACEPLRNFLHGAIGLVDRGLRLSRCGGIRVGDADTTKTLSADDIGTLVLRPVRIVDVLEEVGIAVGPPIYRDRFDVAIGIESPGAQHSPQLIADVVLKCLKRCRVELHLTETSLLSRGKTRLAGHAHHMQNYGLIGFLSVVICTHAHGEIHVHLAEVPARAVDHGDPQVLQGLPVAQLRVGIN